MKLPSKFSVVWILAFTTARGVCLGQEPVGPEGSGSSGPSPGVEAVPPGDGEPTTPEAPIDAVGDDEEPAEAESGDPASRDAPASEGTSEDVSGDAREDAPPPASSVAAPEAELEGWSEEPWEPDAELPERGKPKMKVSLSLDEAIRIGLQNNLDIQVTRLDESIRKREIVVARAVFDPFFNLGATYAKNRDPSVSFLVVDPTTQGVGVSPSESLNYYGSLGGRYLLGTEYELRLSQSELDRPTLNPNFTFLNPINDTEISATLRQPLLKGGWYSVNTADVRIAENSYRIAQDQIEVTVMDTVFQIEGAYWDLVFATKNLAAKETALRVTEQNRDNTQLKKDIGTMAAVDVTTASSQVAIRKAEFEDAWLLVETTRDRLLDLVNYTGERSLKHVWEDGDPLGPFDNVEIECTSSPEPGGVDMTRDQALAAAFTHRPEYRQMELSVENQEIRLDVAKNGMLPSLDLIGQWKQLGLQDTFAGSFNELSTGKYYNWFAGVEFSVPLSNRGPRNVYRNSRDQLRKLKLQRMNLENIIVLEVDQALRDISSLRRRIRDLEERVRLQIELLRAERVKLDVGKSIPYLVAVMINDLVDNQAQALRAKADLQRTRAQFYRATGTLLERHKILVGDDD